MNTAPSFEKYPFHIDLLPEGEGEGCTIMFPDLPGCIADGATEKEAIANAREAFNTWIASALEDQAPIPAPHSASVKPSDKSDAFSIEQRESHKRQYPRSRYDN